MQAANDPISQPIHVNADIFVNFCAPRRQIVPISIEAVDRLLAQIAHEVYGGLEIETLLVHDNGDHIVRVSLGLLDIVGKYIL
jgi:hypothetical protein